jgi:hypothetical protein
MGRKRIIERKGLESREVFAGRRLEGVPEGNFLE